jgi:hypothetical protein
VQAKTVGVGPADRADFEAMVERITAPNEKIKHPVYPAPVQSAESEFRQISNPG